MNWVAKIIAYHVLSITPGGGALYRFLQERVTKSIVPTHERIEGKLKVGLRYWEWLKSAGRTDCVVNGTHLDFGAGWLPTIPLFFYCLGMQKQYLFDLIPPVRVEYIRKVAHIVTGIVSKDDFPYRSDVSRAPDFSCEVNLQRSDIYDRWGFVYAAPYEHLYPQLTNSIDLVTSTEVLMHIHRSVLRDTFSRLFSVLRPGGIFAANVHLDDLYRYVDGSVSRYHHLRFSPWVWEHLVNSRLMSYNRLKARDYRELLAETGFAIEYFEIEEGTEEDIVLLRSLPVHPSFRTYSEEELVQKHLFFVARKP